jgi:quinolinate synthase
MIKQIQTLKKQKNALIIAHYYQLPEIQDIADYVGDSYGMALFAKKSPHQLAVVCGVRFMAETFKIMNLGKKILLPDMKASCSLADTCTPHVFAHFKARYPEAFVMTYINSSVEIKAMSDVIVTSSNAVKIAGQVPKDRPIIFGPDQHLGSYIAKKFGRPMILFPGNCFVHSAFSGAELQKLRKQYPGAKVIAHPECPEDVLSQADFIGSTTQLLQFTQSDPSKIFIVMTEAGILHQMKKANPNKQYILGPDINGCRLSECPHMKLITPEKVYQCLLNESPEITLDPTLAEKARKPLERMMTMAEA